MSSFQSLSKKKKDQKKDAIKDEITPTDVNRIREIWVAYLLIL